VQKSNVIPNLFQSKTGAGGFLNIICVRDPNPDWDSLPVWTMKTYEHSGYLNRPFVQVRACLVPQIGFWVQVLAYENAANYKHMEGYEDNHVMLKCNLNPDQGQELFVTVSITGQYLGFEGAKVKMLYGEDLQGVFWGVDIIIANKIIDAFFNKRPICGDVISFNVTKRWQNNFKYFHSGTLFNNGDHWGTLTNF
jgi:hypothetical protein